MEQSGLVFTDKISDCFSQYCKDRQIEQAIMLVDNHTENLCLPLLNHSFPVIVIPSGELHKNLETFEFVLKKLTEYHADRQTFLFNLGGGVVSDIGGFAASVFKRGIRYVNIPTTLMGMVDAAIGGKTGVDYRDYKNYLGVFNLPETVIISTEFLSTLPLDETESAWAEILKTALITSPELLNKIAENADIDSIIRLTAKCKEEITQKDFKDEHIRQLLNFGHTIGHAFESYRLSIQQPVLHGIAVAKGMMYETGLALKLGLISIQDSEFILSLLKDKLHCEELTENEWNGLQSFLSGDKKNSGGFITFSLPVGLGRGTYGMKVALTDLKI